MSTTNGFETYLEQQKRGPLSELLRYGRMPDDEPTLPPYIVNAIEDAYEAGRKSVLEGTAVNARMKKSSKMKVLQKYKIPIDDRFNLQLPIGATVLTVQTQWRGRGGLKRKEAHIFACVDAAQPTETRYFQLYKAGNSVDDASKFIGAFQPSDDLVLHLFEVQAP